MTSLPTTGSNIGQYEIVEQIGTGGMATVYKARQAKLDRHVAIKIMHQIFLSDNNFLARFEREARIVARLDHPNIVPVYDYDDLNGLPYLVMKFVEGRTLKDVLSEGPLPLERILEIVPAIASALTYAHSQGVLHRDVKPSNILIDDRGVPYLTDFGLARIAKAGESTMSADMMLGTPHYISPEQAQGGSNLDARTDVYSLGVVLYELVVGRTPFSGDTPYIIVHKHIYNEAPHPTDLNEDIPLAVSNVILRALSKQPDDRWATPTDMANAFREAVKESGLSHLSDDRASVSQRAFSQIPSQPPVQVPARKPKEAGDLPAHKQAMEAVVAQVTTSFKGDKVISIPSPVPPAEPVPPQQALSSLLSQETLSEVGVRFREAVADIRDQVANGELFQTLKSGAKEVMVEIQTQVEANSGKFDFNFGEGQQKQPGQVTTGSSATKSRKNKVIQREWGMDDQSIRRRVGERISERRGLMVHAVVYLFIGIGLIGSLNAGITPFLSDLLKDEPELLPLTTVPWALVIQLLWGGGLIGHMLDVYGKTGRRWDNRRRSVQNAMVKQYGENWMDVATDSEYKKVRNRIEKRIDSRIGFFQHFVMALMLSVSGFIIWEPIQRMLNLLLERDNEALAFINGVPIPAAFALFMALTVVIHGIDVLIRGIFSSERRDDAIEREIQREREMMSVVKAKNEERTPAPVRLTEDGEFTDSFVQDLESPKVKRR